MRILWVSKAPWATGEYSRQTALVTPRLRASGHDVAIAAYSGIFRGIIEWQGIPVYPVILGDPRTQTLIGMHYNHGKADLMICLHDAGQIFEGPAFRKEFAHVRRSFWMPISSEVYDRIAVWLLNWPYIKRWQATGATS